MFRTARPLRPVRERASRLERGAEPFSPQAFDEAFFAASALGLARRACSSGDYSARELLDAVWERILRRNPTLNALAAYDHEAALRDAAAVGAADLRAARRGRWRDCRSPSRTVSRPPA